MHREEDESRPLVGSFFARQPIFDAGRGVSGYELLYRGNPQAPQERISQKDAATLSLILAAILETNGSGTPDGGKVCIPFSRGSILSGAQAALPPQSTVVAAEPQEHLDPEYAQALRALKNQGFTLALSLPERPTPCDPAMLDLADVVFVDMRLARDAAAPTLLAALARPGRALCARRVEDQQSYSLARDLGFDLFQGFFFEKPTIVPGRQLPAGAAARLRLMQALRDEDMDLDKMTAVIESDVAISFKLLTFINSAALGLRHKISSIRHALMMLGWNSIKSWLWLVVLSDLIPRDKTPELRQLASIRARFLALAGAQRKNTFPAPDSLFLLGLFSLLEPMLDVPMADIARHLPLDQEMLDALCGRDSPCTPWLEMAQCFETADWSRMDHLTMALGLDPLKVATAYCDALVWAKGLSGSSGAQA